MIRRLLIALGGSMAVAAIAMFAYAAAPGSGGEASGKKSVAKNSAEKIVELERKIAALEARIAVLEQKGSGFVTVPAEGIELNTVPAQPNPFNAVLSLPKGWSQQMFNGAPVYTVPLSGGAEKNPKSENSSGAIIWGPSSPGAGPLKGTEGVQLIAPEFSPAEPIQPATENLDRGITLPE